MRRLLIILIALVLAAAGGYYYFFMTEDNPCANGIQDPGEEDVDCGGPCEPCPTCQDGIQNQGEGGIDCGGPCPDCISCKDGVRNQGETDVDCGGPCEPCPGILCGFLGEGVAFTVEGSELKAESIKKAFLNTTSDRIYLDPQRKAYQHVAFRCRWGGEVGEQVNLYYCMGNYTAPQLKPDNTIYGYVHKIFKVGFNVKGETNNSTEKTNTKLTTAYVDYNCLKAKKPDYA
ncbi:MAG: hypothetical protein GF334_03105 [Candidatus Altiarchaeales archaeon]|nr:hypothetical protein [Candidatus Altiarchaeales archaeon]